MLCEEADDAEYECCRCGEILGLNCRYICDSCRFEEDFERECELEREDMINPPEDESQHA